MIGPRRLLVTVALCAFAALARADLKASLDTDHIGPGETVRLTLDHDGQTSEQPDIGPLRRDFDVLVTSRSSSVQLVNGNLSSHVRTQLTLSPKRDGRLMVPSISWAGERSPELTLTVNAAAANGAHPAGQAAKVFVETVVEEKQPFVQAAVNVNVRVFTTEQLYQASLELPASNDVLVQQIGGDENRTVERNGLRYDVVERHYVMFPQHSGDLKLPGAVLSAQIAVHLRADPFGNDAFADSFGIAGGTMTTAKPLRVVGDEIDLHVLPRPAQSQAGYWLPARGLRLTGEWRPDQPAHVGEPVSLNLHLQADDLTAAQLPDLSAMLTLPAGVKAYPDAAKLNNIGQGDRIVGTRDQNIALIAEQPGQFTVPEMQVHWWDTQANEARVTTLPPHTLSILPAVNGAPPALPNRAPALAAPARDAPGGAADAVQRVAKGEPLWLWVSLALAALWALTLLAWWSSRRRKAEHPPAAIDAPSPRGGDARGERTRFLAACARNDAPAARKALLAWAAKTWPEHPPPGLQGLALQLNDADIGARLAELDRACFGGESWNGAPLAAALRELPAQKPASRGGGSKLAPLYP